MDPMSFKLDQRLWNMNRSECFVAVVPIADENEFVQV